jgi:DnaJ family protein B protein 4
MPGMGGGGFPGGMPGGFGGMDSPGGGSSAPPPPGEIIRPLALTLEELYAGGTKRLKITRHMRNGSQEERVLEVVYKPGWKKVNTSSHAST